MITVTVALFFRPNPFAYFNFMLLIYCEPISYVICEPVSYVMISLFVFIFDQFCAWLPTCCEPVITVTVALFFWPNLFVFFNFMLLTCCEPVSFMSLSLFSVHFFVSTLKSEI